MINNLQHPTQLWISDQAILHNQIILYLQKKLCLSHGCQNCITCKQIIEHEHPYVIWLEPERSYNVDQIDELISMASFQLDNHEQRFFIIQQAERLTDQCSNRLLKTIEEPFPGYNFFFLTERPEALPLTITSRCVIQKFKSTSIIDKFKNFIEPFLILKFLYPLNFIKQLETLDIKEQETKEIIDNLFEHWTNILKQDIYNGNKSLDQAQAMVHILQQALYNPPMIGSSKIFWKNFYITAHYATKTQQPKN